MAEDIREEVAAAIKRNVEARDRYNRSMHEMSEKLGYTNVENRNTNEKQVLAPPASAEDIEKLEEFIGSSLPPSYRAFLELHDGWEMIDGSPDFLPISQILEIMDSEERAELIDHALERGNGFVQDSLVIGTSGGSADRYLLNPNNKTADGEWEFVDYDKADFDVYRSFLDYLIESEKVYLSSVSENTMDDYFDPFED